MEHERPTITDFSLAQHPHGTDAGGGPLEIVREMSAFPGLYTTGEVIYEVPCVTNHSFPADMVGSLFFCKVAPSGGDAVVTLKQAGVATVTITFLDGQDVSDPGVVACAAWAQAPGEKFQVVMPVSVNATFEGFHGAMLGVRL